MSAGKHRVGRNARRGGVLAVAGLSALTLTGASAAASTPTDPAPATTDCVSLTQALVTAQTGENGKSTELRKAEKADKQAQQTRDDAVIAAGNDYKLHVAAANAAYDASAKTAADATARDNAIAAALATYNAKKDAAQADYEAGGTAAGLTRAQKQEAKTSGVLAGVKLDLGKYCVTTPAGFATCADAFAAGVHDIPASDPRYRKVLDSDGDGVACEQPPAVTPPAPVTEVPAPAPVIQGSDKAVTVTH